MLDTNMVSYILSGRSSAARERYRTIGTEADVAISTIAEAEILAGLAKKPAATQLKAASDALLLSLHRLGWDSNAATSFAFLSLSLSRAGLSLSTMDHLIAAHAHSQQAVLVTHDRAFHRLAEFLTIEDWATDL